jgi:energy-coupling factor transporter ATP-binding protein EcfA2
MIWACILLISLGGALCADRTVLREPQSQVDLAMPASLCAVRDGKGAVISPIEWQELQLDDLVTVISEYATTKLGPIGLQWLIMPLNDRIEIENRQRIIRTLVGNEQLLWQLDNLLKSIKKGEASLLKSAIMPSEMKGLSYHIHAPIDSILNRSAVALDAYAFAVLVFAPANLIYLSAVKLASMLHNYDPRIKKMTPQQLEAVAQGATLTVPEASNLKLEGSAGDRIKVAQAELFNDDQFVLFLRKHLGKYLFPENNQIKISPFAYNVMSHLYTYGDQIKDDLMVLSPAFFIYWMFKQLYDQLTIQQARYAELAHATRAFKKLGHCIQDISRVAHSVVPSHVSNFIDVSAWDTDIKDLVNLLESSTFDSVNSWIYRRGNVVKACNLHEAVGQKIVPFLQTIAEWDGYCALAKMYKALESRDARYCFAEFVDSKAPYLAIDAAWTPLARANNPVGNQVRIGCDGHAIRLFLTGPNGCGKSTYMKAILHSVVMAQSCGIVPGSSAQLALFEGIRTSLHPQEDVLQGISTFMAQKLRIDSVVSFAAESNEQRKVLVMFDEPFSGTIDSQIEMRVYQLGQELLRLPYAAACVATHVERPTVLAAPNIFDNYQVEIKEVSHGEFTRTFKIRPGVARWWFTDQAKVTRFVDWLGRYKKQI